MTKLEQQLHQHISRKCRASLIISLSLVLGLSIVKMVLSNRGSTWGRNLKNIHKQTLLIQKQNLKLKAQLAQKAGGLNQLAETAKQQGFVDQVNYQYFSGGQTVAQVLP